MGKCERCGVELSALQGSIRWEQTDSRQQIQHSDARCADRLKTQRDEARARAEAQHAETLFYQQATATERAVVDALRAERDLACENLRLENLRAEKHRADNDQLRAELEKHDENADYNAKQLYVQIHALQAELARQTEALREAAQSLRTISDQSGIDEYMKDILQIRGYANNRATVACAVLAEPQAGGEIGAGRIVGIVDELGPLVRLPKPSRT